MKPLIGSPSGRRPRTAWMSDKIRKLIAKRRGVFRKKGRSVRWKDLKRRSVREIRERRSKYKEHIKDKLIHKTDSK